MRTKIFMQVSLVVAAGGWQSQSNRKKDTQKYDGVKSPHPATARPSEIERSVIHRTSGARRLPERRRQNGVADMDGRQRRPRVQATTSKQTKHELPPGTQWRWSRRPTASRNTSGSTKRAATTATRCETPPFVDGKCMQRRSALTSRTTDSHK